jgi:hypothetical protein
MILSWKLLWKSLLELFLGFGLSLGLRLSWSTTLHLLHELSLMDIVRDSASTEVLWVWSLA